MKNRWSLLLTLLFFVPTVGMVADDHPVPERGKTYVLVSFRGEHGQHDMKVCGEYFARFFGKDWTGGDPAVVTVGFMIRDDKGRIMRIVVDRDKFVTIIDDRVLRPTITMEIPGISRHLAVRISRKEFEASQPCLPDPNRIVDEKVPQSAKKTDQ